MSTSSFTLLQVPVHAVSLSKTVSLLMERAHDKHKGYVIFRDVHGVIRCQDDPEFLEVHRQAFLVCPDGMPVVWFGRWKGYTNTERVYGPDLMRALMSATQDGSQTHYLYGGNVGVAERLKASLEQQFPGVRIIGTFTPPFGPLSEDALRELQAELQMVNPDFFWVGLSTPKQEFFMQRYGPELSSTVMLGVGAAFDYLSGAVREPSPWIQKTGLQWLVRIFQEPKRLLGRYVRTIPRFLFLIFRDECVGGVSKRKAR